MHAANAAGGDGRRRLALATALAVAAALAIPTLAAAHPAVYELEPKTLPPSPAVCNYGSDSSGSCLVAGAKRYAVANDGFAMTFTENGEGGSGGVLNYQQMPGGFRKWSGGEMTSEQKRTFPPAQTQLQAHATCQGVAALESGASILAWQGADPFFNYVPWQKASAGLGDEPSSWMPVVQSAVGVDLGALSGEAEFKTACEGKGGTYRKADASSNPATNAIAEAVKQASAPLEAEVTELLAGRSGLQTQVDAWLAKGGALEAERTALGAEKVVLQRRVEVLRKTSAKRGKTIERLRKQLRAARNG